MRYSDNNYYLHAVLQLIYSIYIAWYEYKSEKVEQEERVWKRACGKWAVGCWTCSVPSSLTVRVCPAKGEARRVTKKTEHWTQSGWAFGHYVLGFVQGLPKTARNCPKLPETVQNCPKLFLRKYIVKIILFSIKIN